MIIEANQSYRRLLAKPSLTVREYKPIRRTIRIENREYNLQFPYVILALVQQQRIHIAFAMQPIESIHTELYFPALPNVIWWNWQFCLGEQHVYANHPFDLVWQTAFNHEIKHGKRFAKKYFGGYKNWSYLKINSVLVKMRRSNRYWWFFKDNEHIITYKKFLDYRCGQMFRSKNGHYFMDDE